MKLKAVRLSLVLSATLLAAASQPPAARADTVTATTAPTNDWIVSGPGALSTNASPAGFISTAIDYFKDFNPNLTNTFSTNKNYAAWTGASYQAGVNLGASIGLEAKPFAGLRGLQLRSVSTLGAVVGTIAAEEIDIGYAIDHIDTEFSFYGGGEYDAVNHAEHLVIAAEIKKALTDNTFAGGAIEGKFLGARNSQPEIIVFGGFTF